MKESPIIFSSESVNAIFAGEKTQTRRVVKPQPTLVPDGNLCGRPKGSYYWPSHKCRSMVDPSDMGSLGPYGGKYDLLWVKETWKPFERPTDHTDGIVFKADGAFVPIDNTREAAERWVVAKDNRSTRCSSPWRSPLFMPRWACRLLLEVRSIRVERLHAITEADARAEGIDPKKPVKAKLDKSAIDLHVFGPDAVQRIFRMHWDSINGEKHPWVENPFVWVITFTRVCMRCKGRGFVSSASCTHNRPAGAAYAEGSP